MNKLKILFIATTSALGGAPQQMHELIKGLDHQYFQAIAVCPNDGPYFQKLQKLGIKAIDLPIRSLSPRALFELMKIVKREEIDLIHSHGKGAGIYSRPLGFLTGTPVVHTFHGLHYRTYHLLFRQAYLWIERLLGCFTAEIINVSQGERVEALTLTILRPTKGTVIYNGIDLSPFDIVISNPSQKRAELGIKKGIPIIGIVARINIQKGLEYLLKSLLILSFKIPNFKCLIIGDAPPSEGGLKFRLLNLVKEMNLQDYVLFTGYREDIPDLLKIFDLYVTSSLWEGLPIALLEAMACRKAIVATDVVGNNEVVVDGETGFLVPPRDPEALTEKIIQLLEDPSLCRKFGYMGRRRVELHFSCEAMVQANEEVYRIVLRSRDN